eukprot:scaffold9638_cov73-Skeletonema_marinoi.AAC.1
MGRVGKYYGRSAVNCGTERALSVGGPTYMRRNWYVTAPCSSLQETPVAHSDCLISTISKKAALIFYRSLDITITEERQE